MKRLLSFTCLAAIAMTSYAVADERATSKQEDDAWYDVSEWFDGNDYNPTDEAIGRWDNERFSYNDNRNSGDADNDDEAVDSKSYYGDHHDDGYAWFSDDNKDNRYESYSRNYDTTGDGLYNGRANFRDDDNDGVYDKYSYRSYDNNPESRQRGETLAKNELKDARSDRHSVSGKVTKTDMVKEHGDISLIAKINSQDGQEVCVNFGSNATDLQIFKGDTITVSGPMTKVGDKKVLLATELELKGENRQIERSGRSYTGTVKSTRNAKMGDKQRNVAKIKTDDGKMLTVDLGDSVSGQRLSEGDKVTVTGVPVRAGDRVVLVATTTRKK